jgi:hypothetical protein
MDDLESSDSGKEIAVYCPVCAQREFEVVSVRGLPYT